MIEVQHPSKYTTKNNTVEMPFGGLNIEGRTIDPVVNPCDSKF